MVTMKIITGTTDYYYTNYDLTKHYIHQILAMRYNIYCSNNYACDKTKEITIECLDVTI